MVDEKLLEHALQLDAPARKELVAALQDSLHSGEVSPEIAAIIDKRVAQADAAPGDCIPFDEFERRIRSQRARRQMAALLTEITNDPDRPTVSRDDTAAALAEVREPAAD